MVRDPGRSTQQDLTSILDKYVPEWMGKDPIDGLCFYPLWVQSYVCCDLPMNRIGVPTSSRMIFEECESSKTPRWSQLIRAERSSNGPWRSHCAPAGSSRTRAHGDFSLSPTASSLYSPQGWRFRTSSLFTMLDVFVALPSFALFRSSLDSDSLFFFL